MIPPELREMETGTLIAEYAYLHDKAFSDGLSDEEDKRLVSVANEYNRRVDAGIVEYERRSRMVR